MTLLTSIHSPFVNESSDPTPLQKKPRVHRNCPRAFHVVESKTLDCPLPKSQVLPSPQNIWTEFPLTATAAETAMKGRWEIERILEGMDRRKIIVVGPCSIHDSLAAIEYAWKLKPLAELVRDKMLLRSGSLRPPGDSQRQIGIRRIGVASQYYGGLQSRQF